MRLQTRLLSFIFATLVGGLLFLWILQSHQSSPSFRGTPQIDFLTATVADLLMLLETGTVTSEELIAGYLARIDKNNYHGLNLRAVLETAPRENLLEQARQYDIERRNGKVRGRLHGVPILVKDNIATDASLGMNTTAGSFALRIF